ncbi:MAG: GNAT family N-acetyltransferase [Muribaculaceae bacterium]|nr:GNAT family N-acetyltransferase [Muribaculaceae bacterium]
MKKDNGVRLRAVEVEDAQLMFDMEGEGFDDDYGDVVAPLSLNMLRTYAMTYDADPFSAGSLRLIAEVDERVVGMVDLYDVSAIHQRAEVGIYVCRVLRGKGYAKRILSALETYCIEKLSIIALLARTYSENTVACRLFESAGYSFVGVLEGWQKKGGKFHDVNLYLKRMEFD